MSRVFVDKVLGVDEETGAFVASDNFDVTVIGLTGGSVKLQVMYKKSDVGEEATWKDYPGGTFVEDTAKILSVIEEQVAFKLVGLSNNAGVYVRLGRKV